MEQQKLKRVLGLWDLVFYGLVLIQPIAAVGLFGVAQKMSRGHMVATILIAMVAMTATAVSYGRMAAMYPSAGSAYTFVSRGLNVHLGFLAGWATVLDYLIIPVVSTTYASLTLTRVVPRVPFAAWVVVIVLLVTAMNLRGIRSTARWNVALLCAMCAVIAVYFVLATVYLLKRGALLSSVPIYNPPLFQWKSVMTATSFAALTYIGFDGVTTLAEEVENPRRNVLLATVTVCLLTGVFSAVQIYLAARVWPDYNSFPNVETAFFDVCGRIGGKPMFQAMAATLLVACVGSALTGQVGAARLLYSMGRDRVLPRRPFGLVDARSGVPRWNLLLIAGLTVLGSLLLSYEQAAEVLNFGAFLAFMGVNMAVFSTYFLRAGERHIGRNVAAPALGFLFCAVIWWNLPLPAKQIGGAWLLLGLLYLAALTRGFRRPPTEIRFQNEDEVAP